MDRVVSLWVEVEWGFYALSASKAIFRARTYNCNLFSPVMMSTWAAYPTQSRPGCFCESCGHPTSAEPRDSFFGGRTNASMLYCAAGEGERIRYVDFTSLYPYVNKYCEYPRGHPKIIKTRSVICQCISG